MPYQKARSLLGTGDLVFFFGTSDAGVLIEELEEAAGWPPYSHVGMVVKDGDGLYLWDAPGSGNCFTDPYASDPDNNEYKNPVHTGCRVSELDEVLAYYMTKVGVNGFWVRQLTSGVSEDRFGALRRFVNRVDGQPFPSGPSLGDPEVTGLAANYVAGQKGMTLFYGTYFCAQLVADSYMHMGLLEMDVFPPNGYSPAAFAMNEPTTRLPLVAPATLGDVFFVDWGNGPTGGGTPCNQ